MQIVLRIWIFCLCAIFSLAHADPQQSIRQQLQHSLNAAIVGDSSTPGAVLLVASPSLGIITVAAGFADEITQTPMRVDNNFRIASISKTFLAVTMLKLSEEGEIDLDEKIAELLPSSIEVNRIPNGNKVTVRELLQMRSGMPEYSDYDAYTDVVKTQPNHHWKPEDGIQMIYDGKPNFAPGKSYEYSNTNYILLQSIIEKLTGTTLAAQFKKYIFSPLHLKNTYVEIQEERAGGFHGLKTHGYKLENKKLTDVTTLNDGLGLGDGGIVSTAEDLAIFVQALLQSKVLLAQDSLNNMLKVKGPDKYGLGIYKEQVGEEWAWTHNGSSAGFAGQFYYFPDKKLTIIILTNSFDSNIIADLAAEVLAIIEQ